MKRLMEQKKTTQTSSELINFNPSQATLLEMRADPQRFPRLCRIPREEAIPQVVKIVAQAFLYRGQAADPTNIQFIASTLVDELMEDRVYGARYISMAEMQAVIKRAVLDSDMFGVSVASLYKVVMEYVKGEGHANQKRVEAAVKTRRDNYPGYLSAITLEFANNLKTSTK